MEDAPQEVVPEAVHVRGHLLHHCGEVVNGLRGVGLRRKRAERHAPRHEHGLVVHGEDGPPRIAVRAHHQGLVFRAGLRACGRPCALEPRGTFLGQVALQTVVEEHCSGNNQQPALGGGEVASAPCRLAGRAPGRGHGAQECRAAALRRRGRRRVSAPPCPRRAEPQGRAALRRRAG